MQNTSISENTETKESRIHETGGNAFADMVGIEVTEVGEGWGKTRLKIRPEHLNPIGSVHGGVIATLLDNTGGVAAYSHGWLCTTLDCNIHYLRPGVNTSCLYGEAEELKHGKRISVYEVRVKDQNGVILADAIFTYMNLGEPITKDSHLEVYMPSSNR